MSLKANQLTRIATVIAAVAAIDFTSSTAKKTLREEASKGARGYGVLKSHVEDLPVLESLVKELSDIKPAGFQTPEAYQEALKNQADSIVATLEKIQGQVEQVDDSILSNAAEDPTGNSIRPI